MPISDATLCSCLSTDGGLILDFKNDTSPGNLLALAAVLGRVVDHDRSGPDGIYEIVVDPEDSCNFGGNSLAQPPHTDSPFRPDPPQVVAFQCVRSAGVGGESILVRGESVALHLLRTCPEALWSLSAPDSVQASRGGFAKRTAVFRQYGERWRIAYRQDRSAQMQAYGMADTGLLLIRDYVESERNQLMLHLLPGQILILDNTRVLHGRTAFSAASERKLRRLWFDGTHPDLKLGFHLHNGSTGAWRIQVFSA